MNTEFLPKQVFPYLLKYYVELLHRCFMFLLHAYTDKHAIQDSEKVNWSHINSYDFMW